MITVTARCIKHPRYKAIHRPRCKCAGCWSLFTFVNQFRAAPMKTSSFTHDALGALDTKVHWITVRS